jgi:predicted dehydrogenase
MATEQRPVRFGYVGCGFMAQKAHLPNFHRIPGCALTALAEVRTGLRDRIADRYRIPRRYSSHEEMARDPEIEAVGVSAGYALQGQMARDLLRAGKHVFMEKRKSQLAPLVPGWQWRIPPSRSRRPLP